jgi:hypothetical protein
MLPSVARMTGAPHYTLCFFLFPVEIGLINFLCFFAWAGLDLTLLSNTGITGFPEFFICSSPYRPCCSPRWVIVLKTQACDCTSDWWPGQIRLLVPVSPGDLFILCSLVGKGTLVDVLVGKGTLVDVLVLN